MPGRRLLALVLAVASVGISAAPVAARGPVVIGTGIHYRPLDSGDIVDRVDLPPVSKFPTPPFRVAAYQIRILAWADLPMNGQSLPRLSTPPNSDPSGIPYKVVSGKNYYSPGNIAADGIRFVDAYVRTGHPAHLDRARVRAAKLVEIGIRKSGALYLPYGFNYPFERLTAPWVSAYSQGLALSFFSRLYRVTGEYGHAVTARAIFIAFRLLGPTLRHWVAYVSAGDLWLEEYPSATPTHVLNGFNFALFGLYDYERLTRDPAAAQFLQGGLATMRRRAAAYRVPGGISYYDLVHRTQLEHYHAIAIWQFMDLAAISGETWFTNFAALLQADHPVLPATIASGAARSGLLP